MRTFSYREAAILLGGRQSKIVTALDKVTSGIMLATTFPISAVLSWFDAKADFARLSHELLSSASEAKRGLRRFDRTQRIEAAHTVIVMTAFFEAFAKLDLPFSLSDIDLTAAEQREIQRSTMPQEGGSVGDWLRDPLLLPAPDQPYETNLRAIQGRYASMGHDLYRFVRRLVVWDQVDEVAREKLTAQIRVLPDHSVARYEVLFRGLVTEFPEAACWANLIDHQATRAEVKIGLAGLEKLLTEMIVGHTPDDRRASLARSYRAQLAEPLLRPDEVSHQFTIPTVEDAYINPRFRVGAVHPDSSPSQEPWWEPFDERSDIHQYLVAYLTSSQASRAPLVVLGQPGAGKSMLTKVLAARLPATDFMPIRVPLRDVPVEADIQEQIEQAIRHTTGDRVEWTDLARSAGDAIPVILLDGFDELLQATGAHQVDYLTKVGQFQKREADQGRPLAAIVTTRIAVAGLARFPEESIALRLDPFHPTQVEAWVATWNAANSSYFANTGLTPLTAESVLAYPELATQPLLLTMLALYDADKNALQNSSDTISRSELYERLLVQFARREVVKSGAIPESEMPRAVEHELGRLSLVAFAMFNRGTQWVSQKDLNSDFAGLSGDRPSVEQAGWRRHLDEAELTIGRFFFIHRARAQQADKQVETYEFLHATFAEYLVARMVWQLVRDLASKESAARSTFFGSGPVEDGTLHALLSFSLITELVPIVMFLDEMSSELSDAERESVTSVLLRLFRTVSDPRPERATAGYLPQTASVPKRHAAYSANLVILITLVVGEIRVSELYGRDTNVIGQWQSDALLWRSQTRYYSLLDMLAFRRTWNGEHRDAVLTVAPYEKTSPVQLEWTYSAEFGSAENNSPVTFHQDKLLMRRQNFFASAGDDVVMHALEPVTKFLSDWSTRFVTVNGVRKSAAHMVLEFLLSSFDDDTTSRAEIYPTFVFSLKEVCANPEEYTACAGLVATRLGADPGVTASQVARVLNTMVLPCVPIHPAIRCILQYLGLDGTSDKALMQVARQLLTQETAADHLELLIEYKLRLAEVGIDDEVDHWNGPVWQMRLQELAATGTRPDLVRRGEWLVSHYFGRVTGE
ncbi:NACHT domain-containing protein [Kibdelosporangium lantanae]|uniref:NACHT domain-containing protein n=1 Tax=Kibdelosporangium lantanae TaxID=1497396 RepID=A0ABW3M3V6_9PSEU